MGLNDIYLVDLVTLANNIYMRNSFHFQAKGVNASAFSTALEFRDSVIPYLKPVTSAYVRFYGIYCRLVSEPLLDEWQMLLEDSFGHVAATPADPRLGVWIQTRSSFGQRPFGTGGFCYGAIPYNWLQFPPVIEGQGLERWGIFRDNMMAAFGGGSTVAGLRWGIFSRNRWLNNPVDKANYWYPITQVKIRPTAVTRRTRRPKIGL